MSSWGMEIFPRKESSIGRATSGSQWKKVAVSPFESVASWMMYLPFTWCRHSQPLPRFHLKCRFEVNLSTYTTSIDLKAILVNCPPLRALLHQPAAPVTYLMCYQGDKRNIYQSPISQSWQEVPGEISPTGCVIKSYLFASKTWPSGQRKKRHIHNKGFNAMDTTTQYVVNISHKSFLSWKRKKVNYMTNVGLRNSDMNEFRRYRCRFFANG